MVSFPIRPGLKISKPDFRPQSGMTKNEFLVVLAMLAAVVLISLPNFQTSRVQARDVQRKNDLKHIRAALENYFKDFNAYPRSRDGRILACGNENELRSCEWGEDLVRDIRDPVYPPYINPLPRDPLSPGHSYIYISNTRNFQLFASLEDRDDDEYNKEVAERGLKCGDKVCNFGLTSSRDISIKEELPPENPQEATESGLPNEK